jgi:hypothetical protein
MTDYKPIVIPYPRMMPMGTVKKKHEIHIVDDFGGAQRSIQTGKYITNITWKNPTNDRVAKRIQKFLVKAKTPTNSAFKIDEPTIIFFACIFANNTGLNILPMTLPTYRPD